MRGGFEPVGQRGKLRRECRLRAHGLAEDVSKLLGEDDTKLSIPFPFRGSLQSHPPAEKNSQEIRSIAIGQPGGESGHGASGNASGSAEMQTSAEASADGAATGGGKVKPATSEVTLEVGAMGKHRRGQQAKHVRWGESTG